MDSGIQHAWDIEADQLQKLRSWSLDEARNYAICVWLIEAGDVRPFVDWVGRGHVPSPTVTNLIARMMQKGDDGRVPYILDSKKRLGGRGPGKNREKLIRNALVTESINHLIKDDGWKYDAAIAEIASLTNQSKANVRQVYDAHAKRKAN